MKPVFPSALARRDVEDAVDHYAREAGEDVALRFVAALRNSYRLIALRPATGSPRFAHELDLPGLRHRRLGCFPYLAFYMEQPDRIDIWRVLHAQRDIPGWMSKSA
jgi:toxin ParE1/3/4